MPFEPIENPKDVIQRVHEAGMYCGITLKPGTPISAIEEFIPLVYVLCGWLDVAI